MRFTAQHSSLLLLLLPALTTALSADSADRAAGFRDDDVAVGGHGDVADEDAAIKVTGRPQLGTKDAPVDGKDGKPHLGPFVEPDRPAASKDKTETLPPLKGKPKDTSVLDGEKIPETNDNIMADKDRSKPDEGKTGTEGGVTEKDKARKEKGEGGDMPVAKPASPKEKPPMPHSVEEKLEKTKPSSSKTDTKEKESSKSKTEKEDTSYTGLEVRPAALSRIQDANRLPRSLMISQARRHLAARAKTARNPPPPSQHTQRPMTTVLSIRCTHSYYPLP